VPIRYKVNNSFYFCSTNSSSSWTDLLSASRSAMANDSRVKLKIFFEILTDKEIEALTERAIRRRNFYDLKSAAVGSRRAIPADGEASSIAVCTLQRGPRHAGWSQHPGTGANAPVGSRPLDGANG
jgi:hypothetical protein